MWFMLLHRPLLCHICVHSLHMLHCCFLHKNCWKQMYWWMIHRWGDPCKKVWIHVMPLSGAWWEVRGGSAPSATVFFWLRNWTKRNNWLVSGWLWSPWSDPPLRSSSETTSPSLKIGSSSWTRIHHNTTLTPETTSKIHLLHQSPYWTQGFCHLCSFFWCSLQACCL